jgi:hypothetical protein
MGKYSAVLKRHGNRGFGVPSKAPEVGSFPLYPLNRARFALTIISSGDWDSKKTLRAQIAQRALAAHPSLKSYWSQLKRETIASRTGRSTSTRRKAANPRRNTMGPTNFKYRVSASVIVGSKPKDFSFVVEAPWTQSGQVKAAEQALAKKLNVRFLRLMVEQDEGEFEDSPLYSIASPSNRNITGSVTIEDAVSPSENPRRKTMARRKNYGSITTLSNPYGLSMGKGKAVRTASGNRTHVKGGGNLTLCGSKVGKGSDAKVITCYRCIKLVNMDGLHTVKRDLRYGKRTKHYMVPGGREGKYVSGVDVGSSLSDAEFEQMMGDSNYPTQSLGMIEHIREERTGAKRKRAARKGSLTRRRKKAGAAMIANPRSYKMGYSKGIKDYRSSSPTPASTIRKRSMDYQVGYLEGYAKSGRGR